MAYKVQKRIVSVPSWYSDYQKELEQRQKKELEERNKEPQESLDKLKQFFTPIKKDKKVRKGEVNMPKIDPNTGQQYYTLKERQDYHYKAAEKGSKAVFNGQEYVRSDFARGKHKAIADNIAHRRYKIRQKFEAEEAAAKASKK